MEREVTIVKIQRSTISGVGESLVFGPGKAHAVMVPISSATLKAMGPDMKAYFHAVWWDKYWVIGERAPNQEW